MRRVRMSRSLKVELISDVFYRREMGPPRGLRIACLSGLRCVLFAGGHLGLIGCALDGTTMIIL